MTLLTLERFRQIMGLHPFHFWQLQSPQVPVRDACQRLTFQHAWHNANAVGRSEVQDAISMAEASIADQLGYWPGPHYDVDVIDYPTLAQANLIRMNQDDPRGRWQSTALKWAHVQKVGVEVNTKLTDLAVELCRSKGTGQPIDKFKCNYTVPAGTKVEQLEIWNGTTQVAPVTMVLDGVNLTVDGPAWLLVNPALYEDWEAKDLDPNSEDTFSQSVELRRHYCDPTGNTQDTAQAVLEWETRPPYYGPWCCAQGQDPAALSYALARVGIREAELGYVYLGQAAYDATSAVWLATPFATCTPPDRVTVRYLSGLESLSSVWEVAIARYAAAEIARPICGCDTANAEFMRWQWEVMATGTGVKGMVVSESDKNNPFGTRLGHIYAWRVVRDAFIARAVRAS